VGQEVGVGVEVAVAVGVAVGLDPGDDEMVPSRFPGSAGRVGVPGRLCALAVQDATTSDSAMPPTAAPRIRPRPGPRRVLKGFFPTPI
jgi:hypothetical protein